MLLDLRSNLGWYGGTMILQAGSSTSSASAAAACGDCGVTVSGNFCSSCGADLRGSSLGFLGSAVAPVRRSFPVVYLKILRAPIRATVAFAEDPTYRNYLSFALTGIAIYCLFVVPVVMSMFAPPGGNVQISESLATLMRVLSQVGVYVGIIITFALSFLTFRLLSRDKRSFHAYFKLACIALGFTVPINGAYEFVVQKVFHGTGIIALNAPLPPEAMFTPTWFTSLALIILLFCFYVGIHRRFWNMPIWKAALVYFATSWVANISCTWLMWQVGFYSAQYLIAAGIITP